MGDQVHAFYVDEPTNIIDLAQPALLGFTSPVFESKERLKVAAHCRFPTLSLGATREILQPIADAGSYVHRLEYTVAQIDRLASSALHVALAASIQDLVGSMVPSTTTKNGPLEFSLAAIKHTRKLYMLCCLIGCQHLDEPIELLRLPNAWRLASRTYQFCLSQFDQTLKPLTWRVFVAVLDPWLVQLERMMGPTLASRLLALHPGVYLKDMFCFYDGMRFKLIKERVPRFLRLEWAQMAVECLNCRTISDRVSVPIQFALNEHETPEDVNFALSRLLMPITTCHQQMNLACLELVRPVLHVHIKILFEVFFLQNGVWWFNLRERIAGNPVEQQLQPLQRLLAEITPPGSIKLVAGESKRLVLVYSPPALLSTIITPALVVKCAEMFDLLLVFQQQQRSEPSTVYGELADLCRDLQIVASELSALVHECNTLENLLTAFTSFDTQLKAALATYPTALQ